MPEMLYFDGEKFINNPEESLYTNRQILQFAGFESYDPEELINITETLNNSNLLPRFKKAFEHNE